MDSRLLRERIHALHRSNRRLSDIHVTNLFGTVRQSALDMMAVVGEAYKALHNDEISHLQPDDFVHWTVRLRTSILGVCAVIHHHQEQSYAEVKRKFGEDSTEHEAVKMAFGEIYDNCFDTVFYTNSVTA